MVAALKILTGLQVPPDEPVGLPTREGWEKLEQELGTSLPDDYKEYTSLYGAGIWLDFLGIMDPFYEWQHPEAGGFIQWCTQRLEGLDEVRTKFPEFAPPFDRFPARGGLLAIGYTDNGGTICWETRGKPASWGVVVLAEEYALGYNKYKVSITGFLAGLLERKMVPKTFPPDLYPLSQPAFRSYTSE